MNTYTHTLVAKINEPPSINNKLWQNLENMSNITTMNKVLKHKYNLHGSPMHNYCF